MPKTFPQKESAMYPVIRDYFLKTKGCEVFVDGDKKFTRLPTKHWTAEIDVTALKNPTENDCKIHFIEAKKDVRTQSFKDCFNQVENVKDNAHYLWVAFPQNEWESLDETSMKRNKHNLEDNGFGLLLVNEDGCFPEIEAPYQNIKVEAKNEVLEKLGFKIDLFLPTVETLGNYESKKATQIMVLTCMVADIISEATKHPASFNRYFGEKYDGGYFEDGWYSPVVGLGGHVGIELDPFGHLLKDGLPVVWIHARTNTSLLATRLKQGYGFGTHIYLDNDKWEYKLIPIKDGIEIVEYWTKQGYKSPHFYHRIEIIGRRKDSLKREIIDLVKQARKWEK